MTEAFNLGEKKGRLDSSGLDTTIEEKKLQDKATAYENLSKSLSEVLDINAIYLLPRPTHQS